MQAIDMHMHVPRQPGLPDRPVDAQLREYFRSPPPPTVEDMANKYKELDILGVVFSVDTETTTGDLPDSNDYVADIVREYPDQFIGFCNVDPWKGEIAVNEVERCVRDLGMKGLKLHPVHQRFFPNDEHFYPLYEKCVEMDIPVLFHSGYAGAGSGTPGGSGLKLKYSAPIPCFDDVAADFPQLTIIMAHPGWPWVDEQIAVTLHKANVYMDLSGWSPRFIPQNLVHECSRRLRDKVLFGSDWPLITPDRWLREFNEWDLSDEVRAKILLENAQKVLKLV